MLYATCCLPNANSASSTGKWLISYGDVVTVLMRLSTFWKLHIFCCFDRSSRARAHLLWTSCPWPSPRESALGCWESMVSHFYEISLFVWRNSRRERRKIHVGKRGEHLEGREEELKMWKKRFWDRRKMRWQIRRMAYRKNEQEEAGRGAKREKGEKEETNNDWGNMLMKRGKRIERRMMKRRRMRRRTSRRREKNKVEEC